MVDEILGTMVGRWYVTAFGLSFAVLALRHLGPRRTAIYTVAAIAVGVVAENGSVHYGVPYTRYAFEPGLKGDELFAGDVPLMVSLSYTFMSYFAFAAARLVVGGPRRTRSPMPVLEYLVAVMLAVWALWVVDPVSRLGAHFFLGELFAYDGPGFWFGLPLGSQLGFALTAAILVGVLTWLMRDEPAEPADGVLRHPRVGALGGFVGQVLFMTVTAFVVARTNDDPEVVRVADALAGSTFVIGIPMVLLVAVHWRSLALAERAAAAGSASRQDADRLELDELVEPLGAVLAADAARLEATER
jgi:putative membrane protein